MTSPLPTVTSAPLVPLSTRLGAIYLDVTDAARALAIWRDIVGLTLLQEDPRRLVLGVDDTPLVHLYPGARGPFPAHTLGLYHVAIHVPRRADLARVFMRAARAGLRHSPTDHLVTEALYLWDFDGNGIEITFETPHRGRFVQADDLMAITPDGTPHSGREPIDPHSLIAELGNDPRLDAPLSSGTRIGHVHVHVADLDEAMSFYRDGLGFAGQLLSRRYGMGDVSLDYAPHILAFNVWAGPNAGRAAPGLAGLRHFEIMIEADALPMVLDRLAARGTALTAIDGGYAASDPSGNPFHLLER